MSPLLITLSLVAGQPNCGTNYVQTYAVQQGAAYHAPAYHANAYYAPALTVDPVYLANQTAAYIKAQLSPQLDRIEAKVSQPQPASAPAAAPFIPPPDPIVPTPPNMPPLASVLSRNGCVKCHTGEGASGGFAIFDAPNQFASLDLGKKVAIHEAVKSGRMPPRGDKMPPADLVIIAEAIKSDLNSIASTLEIK